MSVNTDTLKSMCELVVDCSHSTPKWTDEGFVVLRNQNIKNGVLNLSTPSFTNEEDFQKRIKRAAPQKGDIVFTREAPMGEVCMIPEGLECCLGQRQVLLRPKKNVCGEYLFWALQSHFVQHQISWNEGTGSTVSNVRIPVLEALNIPRLPGQEENIAKVLSDLANKIELNRQTNQTLEQIAQAIFKSWFVDFEPTRAKIKAKLAFNSLSPGERAGVREKDYLQQAAMAAISGKSVNELQQLNEEQLKQLKETADLFPDALVDSELGEVPEGWELGKLNDIAELQNERLETSELNSDNYISTENMLENKNGISRASSLPKVKTVPRFEKGNVLVSNIRPYFKKIWLASFKGGRSGDVLGFKCKESNQIEYLYNFLYQDLFFDFMMLTSKGAKMPRGDKAAIQNLDLVFPSSELRENYSDVVKNFYPTTSRLEVENRTLRNIRDVLLPKLLSGELSPNPNTKDVA